MRKIRVLNEDTINKIAAGEAIENPASAVKELVENSIDAGASNIWVEIRGGGFQLIQVSDDGSGMGKDDAVLSFERHATSKISCLEDLFKLYSMGFRGEALASIGAISQSEIVTAEEGKEAVKVDIEGGVLRSVQVSSRAKGTTIRVRSLFYNVPARKKFQKGVSASNAEIHKLLIRLALAYPEIGFELLSNDVPLFAFFPKKSGSLLNRLEHRIDQVFEGAFLKNRMSISQEREGYGVQGFLGSAADHRINRSGQYLFINKRAVTSPLVAQAIKIAYGRRLDERRYPQFVLHLTVPPDKVDVNVHPQKRELRFQEEEWIKQFLIGEVRTIFEKDTYEPLAESAASFAWKDTLPMRLQEVPLQMREENREQTPTLIEDPHVIGLYHQFLLIDASTVTSQGEGIILVNLQKGEKWLILKTLQEKSLQGKSQGLLIPLSLVLTREEELDLENKRVVLHEIGFVLEPSGKGCYLVQSIPPFIDSSDAIDGIKQILQGENPLEKIATFAVRRKNRFMLQEALALWHRLKGCPDSEVIAKIGPYEIENFFR